MPPTLFGQLIVLGLALALDRIGDPPNRWHPVAWMGRLVGWGEANAPAAGPLLRFTYGAILVMLGAAVCTLPLVLALAGAVRVSAIAYIPIAALLLKSTFTYSGLVRAASSVRQALQTGDLPQARRLLSWHLVSRDTSALNEALVTAAAIESVAENITDAVAAPLLFFGLAGVPGAWAYRFFNTCDSMLGYHDPEHEYLGKFAARLDDVLNWLPARLTGLLLILAAWLAREDARGAWRTMWTQHNRTASPNAGWTMSAMAGALNVTLEKVGYYKLEGGSAPLSPAAIQRATRLAGATVILFAALLVTLMLTVTLFVSAYSKEIRVF